MNSPCTLNLETLRREIVGADAPVRTPFGERLMVYADYTASGRCLWFVERYIQNLQRIYANTHTEDDISGRSMTHLLEQAREAPAQAQVLAVEHLRVDEGPDLVQRLDLVRAQDDVGPRGGGLRQGGGQRLAAPERGSGGLPGGGQSPRIGITGQHGGHHPGIRRRAPRDAAHRTKDRLDPPDPPDEPKRPNGGVESARGRFRSKTISRLRQDPQAIGQLFKEGKYPYTDRIPRREYAAQKAQLQIELLKVQNWVKLTGQKIVIIFEGRDAAGKGGTIKRFMEHLNPRAAKVVALEKPTEHERGQWYFQRYVVHLPTRGEILFLDGSELGADAQAHGEHEVRVIRKEIKETN